MSKFHFNLKLHSSIMRLGLKTVCGTNLAPLACLRANLMRMVLHKNARDPGFTLIEVLIAVSIVSIVFVSLYAGMSSAVGFVQLSRENLRATQILQEKMETIRLYTFDQINTPGFIPESFTEAFYSTNNSGVAGAGDFIYNGTVSIKTPSEFTESYATNMRQVTVTLTWTSGRVPRSRIMQTFIARSGLQNYIY